LVDGGVDVADHMELVEDDLLLGPQEVGPGGLHVGLPHVHGDGLDPLQLLGRECGPEAIETLLLAVLSQVEHALVVQLSHHREVSGGVSTHPIF